MAKGKWYYIQSDELRQTVAYDQNSGFLFCKDKTLYTPKELSVITENFTKRDGYSLQVHLLKHVFKGTVIAAGERRPQ